MRTQLVTSMLTVLATNYNNKNEAARLFEISKRFVAKDFPLTEQPQELATMCIGLYGEGEDFFTLKGLLEQVLKVCGAVCRYERSDEPYLHPGRQAKVLLGDAAVAVFGEVHPKVAQAYGIDTKCYVAELKLDALYQVVQKQILYRPLPKFPPVLRDFALLCTAETPVGTLEDAIREGAGKL